jgi:hypothetical protein
MTAPAPQDLHRLIGTTGRLGTCYEPALTIYLPLIAIFRQGTDGHGDRAGSRPDRRDCVRSL